MVKTPLPSLGGVSATLHPPTRLLRTTHGTATTCTDLGRFLLMRVRGQAYGVDDLRVARGSGRGFRTATREFSSSLGLGTRRASSASATTSPGVQNRTGRAPASTNASCHGVQGARRRRPPSPQPSRPRTVGLRVQDEDAQTRTPSSSTEHEPHSPCSHAVLRAGQAEPLRSAKSRLSPVQTAVLVLLAFDAQLDPHCMHRSRARAVSTRNGGAGSAPSPATSSIGLAAGDPLRELRPRIERATTRPGTARPNRRPPWPPSLPATTTARTDCDHHRVPRPDLHERCGAPDGRSRTATMS